MGKAGFIASGVAAAVELFNPKGKQLVTFKGWNGRWWTRIDVGKGVYDAATFVMPFKWSLAVWGVEAIAGAVKKRRRR